jgi:hypothetical protein
LDEILQDETYMVVIKAMNLNKASVEFMSELEQNLPFITHTF